MKIHIIKQGDTFYHLAQKYHVTVDEIIALNPDIDPYNLQVGSKIRIPSISSGTISPGGSGSGMEIVHQHVVKSGDTMWKLSQEWGISLANLIAANPHITNPNALMTGDVINIPKSSSTQAQSMSMMPTSVTLPSVGSVVEQLLPGFQIYTVTSGDTLYHISEQYGVSVNDILALNPNITNADEIMVGMKILIPKASSQSSNVSANAVPSTQTFSTIMTNAANSMKKIRE